MPNAYFLYTPDYTHLTVSSSGSFYCLVSDFYALLDHNKGIWKYLQGPRMSLKQVSKSYRSFLDQFLTSSWGNVKTTLFPYNSLYPSKTIICATFPFEKIVFCALNGSEKFLNVGQKQPETYLQHGCATKTEACSDTWKSWFYPKFAPPFPSWEKL